MSAVPAWGHLTTELAGDPNDDNYPTWWKMFRENLAVARTVAAQFRALRAFPASDEPMTTPPVIVLPAFMAGDFATGVLRRTLAASGVRAEGWGQGVNSGFTTPKLNAMIERIDRLYEECSEKIILIGWSHGGFYARELARRRPDKVAMMITLGTPFGHWLRLLASREGRVIRDNPSEFSSDRPPVYTVACWSYRDGVVRPGSAAGVDGEVHERVQLNCTHNEMTSDPETCRTIVDLLKRGPRAEVGYAGPRPRGKWNAVAARERARRRAR